MLFSEKIVVCLENIQNTVCRQSAECVDVGEDSTHMVITVLNIFLSAHIASFAFFSYFTMETLHKPYCDHVYFSVWVSLNKFGPSYSYADLP
jgi:hypothetical protein